MDVVGVGFHKTGTTTLDLALRHLGYRVKGYTPAAAPLLSQGAVDKILDMATGFDAVQDNPWPVLYREIDERFPAARFILTTRDPNAWLASVLNHFGGRSTPMRQAIYGIGDPAVDPVLFRARYERHERDVRAYFDGQPEKLLVVDWGLGAGWSDLCGFLKKPLPDVPFPHANAKQPAGLRRAKRMGVRLGRRWR
jgi:hypothetical protein